ncbi:hypothetical protein FB451DRAFT_1172332 [Mycena latifolia]|nr:hypothetical protein FB451DRAFT_1172332 [Mycena latifolia]
MPNPERVGAPRAHGNSGRGTAGIHLAASLIYVLLNRQLMFFSEGHFTVITDATHNLDRIASSPQGTQAVVDANMLDFAPDLLGSPNPEVRKWTCQMLEKLAHHKSTMMVVLKELVSLLRRRERSRGLGSDRHITWRRAEGVPSAL